MTEPLHEKITREQQEKIRLEREGRAIAKLSEANAPLTFSEWASVISAAFPDLSFVAEVEMSIIATLLIHDIGSCIALLLVDRASSGKTISLNMFSGMEEVAYPTDQITAAAFITNTANVKKNDLKNIDLLPRIKNKAVLCLDMAPILSTREDDMAKTIGVFTRVLDGEGYQTDTGTHGKRKYKGDYRFVLIGATTPLERRVWKAMSRLGPRMLCLKLHGREKSEDELVGQIQDEPYKHKLVRCREATDEFIKTLWNANAGGIRWPRNDDNECLRIISRCSKLLCRLRGQVSDDLREWAGASGGRRQTIHVYEVGKEFPDRLNQMFYDIARGHAVMQGRQSISMEDMPVILRLTFDSAPEGRWPLMRSLIRADGELGTSQVQAALQCSNPTALKAMSMFLALDICEEADRGGTERLIRIRPELAWFLSEECRQLLERAKLLPKRPEKRSKQL